MFQLGIGNPNLGAVGPLLGIVSTAPQNGIQQLHVLLIEVFGIPLVRFHALSQFLHLSVAIPLYKVFDVSINHIFQRRAASAGYRLAFVGKIEIEREVTQEKS